MYSMRFPEVKYMANSKHYLQILAEIRQDFYCAVNKDPQSQKQIREKEKRLLKKVFCTSCGAEVDTLSEPCPYCTAKNQLEKGENQ